MESKISKLRNAVACGDWRKANEIAAKFSQLGPHKAAIMRAREAYTRPEFQRQLGRDPKALIAAGIAALRERYDV